MVFGCCICAHLPLLGRASCAHAVLVGPHAHMHSWWELGGLNVDVMHTCICGRRGGQISNDGRWVFVRAVSGRMMGWMTGVQGV